MANLNENWETIERVFLSIVNLEGSERTEQLQHLCGGNVAIEREVQQLLESKEAGEAAGFLDVDPVACLNTEGLRQLLGADTADYPALPDQLFEMTPPKGKFGDFELIDEIGRGGMGIVYKARQISPDRIIALKMILVGEFATAEEVELLMQEAQAAGSLDHPGIVAVYEVGEQDGRHFFTMPFVESTNLQKRLAEHPMKPREAAIMIRDVARAVECAHNEGIVHCDLKPSNILIDNRSRPRITDFGIAKQIKTAEKTTSNDRGTPGFMAPEQAKGTVGPPVDIYALGAVLYVSTTGRPPFAAATREETLRQSAEEGPAPIRQLNRAVPKDLETICMKCLNKTPHQRYASAEALADDLDRYLKDQPIHARPPSVAYRATRFVSRHKAASAFSGVAFIAALIATIALTFGVTSARYAKKIEIESLLARSHSKRISRAPGQRFESLANLKQARALQKSPGDDRILELRNEAIACMSLVDLTKSKKWRAPFAHTCAVDAAFKRYAHSNQDGDVRIFDLETHARLLELPGPGSAPVEISFGQKGGFVGIVYQGERDGVAPLLKVWQLTSKKPHVAFETRIHHAWAINNTETRLAYCSESGALVVRELSALDDSVNARSTVWANEIVFDPEGAEFAVSTSEPPQVRVYDAERAEFLFGLPHPSAVRGIQWRGDGKLFAAACNENVHIWEMPSKTQRAILRGHNTIVSNVTFNQRGTLLASASWGNRIHLWDPWTGNQLLSAPGSDWLRFSPDDRQLSGAWIGDHAGIWNVADGREYQVLHSLEQDRDLSNDAPDRGTYWVDYGPHDVLASASIEGARFWNPNHTSEPIGELGIGHCTACVFHPDGSGLITSGKSGVYYWPLTTSSENEGVLTVGSPASLNARPWISGHHLSIGGKQSKVGVVSYDRTSGLLVNLANQKQSTELLLANKIDSIAVSPDGRWAVTGTWLQDSTTTTVFDASTGKAVVELPTGDAWPFFSPTGKWLVTGSSEAYQFWEVGSWKKLHAINRLESGVRGALAFSDDGSIMAVAQSMREVKLVAANDGRQIATLKTTDQQIITALAFNRAATQLAASCQGRVIKVWDLALIKRNLDEMLLSWDTPTSADSSSVAVPVHRVERISEGDELPAAYPPAFANRGEIVNQDSAATWVKHANTEATLGRWERALAGFQVALAKDPTDATIWFSVALLHLHLDEHEAYQRHCRHMNLFFRDSSRQKNRILVAVSAVMGRNSEANLAIPLAGARAMLKANPDSHPNQSILGAVLYRMGKSEEAAEQLEVAIGLAPDGGNPADWLFLALAKAQLGEDELARELLEKSYAWIERNVSEGDWRTQIKFDILLKECRQAIN